VGQFTNFEYISKIERYILFDNNAGVYVLAYVVVLNSSPVSLPLCTKQEMEYSHITHVLTAMPVNYIAMKARKHFALNLQQIQRLLPRR